MQWGRPGKEKTVTGKGRESESDAYPGSVVGTTSRPEDKLITIRRAGVDEAVEAVAAALSDIGQRDRLVADLE
jgi:hypothetical protein